MAPRVLLILFVFFLLRAGAAAQGLIAFPWKACPPVDAEPRCVWVVDATPFSPVRLHENIEGNFHLDFLNPGTEVANVVVQVRSRGGVFTREARFALNPGTVVEVPPGEALQSEDRLRGYVVIRSDRPLLIWAWSFEQHFPRRSGTGPPTDSLNAPLSMSSHSIQVIPVDCSDPNVEKSFGFVCAASDGPPPPF